MSELSEGFCLVESRTSGCHTRCWSRWTADLIQQALLTSLANNSKHLGSLSEWFVVSVIENSSGRESDIIPIEHTKKLRLTWGELAYGHLINSLLQRDLNQGLLDCIHMTRVLWSSFITTTNLKAFPLAAEDAFLHQLLIPLNFLPIINVHLSVQMARQWSWTDFFFKKKVVPTDQGWVKPRKQMIKGWGCVDTLKNR